MNIEIAYELPKSSIFILKTVSSSTFFYILCKNYNFLKINKQKKTVPKMERFSYLFKILDYAKTSFTLFAASSRVIAECTGRPDSSINFLASTALVPCNLTINGTGRLPIAL